MGGRPGFIVVFCGGDRGNRWVSLLSKNPTVQSYRVDPQICSSSLLMRECRRLI